MAITSHTSFPVPTSRARRPAGPIGEPDKGVLVHPQPLLDVALGESPRRKVQTPSVRSETFDSRVAQADAKRAAHVVNCTTLRYEAAHASVAAGSSNCSHCAVEAATWKAETRPRQKYAKLSYAGWRTELASLLDWTSYQRCARPEETRQRRETPGHRTGPVSSVGRASPW